MSYLVSIAMVSLLIILHEAGHFAAARRMGMTVKRYSLGLLHSVVSWTSKKTGIIYQLGILPLGGFVEIKGMNPFEEDSFSASDSFQNKPVWRRGIVLISGPIANLLAAWIILFCLFIVGFYAVSDKPELGAIIPNGPADNAGLKLGDKIVSFNGKPIETWRDFVSSINKNPNKQALVEVERAGKRRIIPVTTRSENGIGRIDVNPPKSLVRAPPHLAAITAAYNCYQIVAGFFAAIVMKITGAGAAVEAVGPVGIVKMAAGALQAGFAEFLVLTANLSVMLFILNMLPLPALDGGKVAFLLYELVTRKRVQPKLEAIVNTVGFYLLIGLLLFVTAGEIFGK